MKIESIEKKLEKILEDYDIEIYSIKPKREFGEKILEILLKGKNITTEKLEPIHVSLVENLEEGDLPDDYYLEISSVGAEYLLQNYEEVVAHIGSYVYVETERFKAIGTILTVEDDTIVLEYNNKGQFRKLKIEYDDVRKIRTSVKI